MCHDYKGGYGEASWAASAADISGAYRLSHWRAVDVFCYFSHILVSIPPPEWTAIAHRHGTKVNCYWNMHTWLQ